MKRFTPLTLIIAALLWVGSLSANAQCASGNCDNGYGTYNYSNGDTYTGNFSGGKRAGYGTYTWANGDQHIGENMNDYLHGQGTCTYKASGDKYIGNYSYGKRSGYGTYFWKNGDKYEGYWQDNKRHGQGTYTYVSGAQDKGLYENDVFKGSGSGPDGLDFCAAIDKVRQSMDGDFSSVKGEQYWDEEKSMYYWATTVKIPGSEYSDIEGESASLYSSAYYKFMKTSSYTDAKLKFDELKVKMQKCLPSDWYEENDENFDNEIIEYVMMDEDYYDFYPGKYISLQLVKDKTDGNYYVEIFFGRTK